MILADLLVLISFILCSQAGWTALVYASLNGQSQAAKALIAEGANVNHQIKVITVLCMCMFVHT